MCLSGNKVSQHFGLSHHFPCQNNHRGLLVFPQASRRDRLPLHLAPELAPLRPATLKVSPPRDPRAGNTQGSTKNSADAFCAPETRARISSSLASRTSTDSSGITYCISCDGHLSSLSSGIPYRTSSIRQIRHPTHHRHR